MAVQEKCQPLEIARRAPTRWIAKTASSAALATSPYATYVVLKDNALHVVTVYLQEENLTRVTHVQYRKENNNHYERAPQHC